MSKIAVIKTGGKQYKITEGDVVEVEKIDAKEGEKFTFDEVLFAGDDKSVKVGDPKVAKAKVEAKVLEQKKTKKVTGFKHKPKKRYLKKLGHRQMMTKVEITKISV